MIDPAQPPASTGAEIPGLDPASLLDEQAWYERAGRLLAQHAPGAALEAILKAEQLAPSAKPIRYLRAEIELALDRPEAALASIEPLLAETIEDSSFRGAISWALARALERMRRPAQAHAAYRQACELLPDEPDLVIGWFFLAANVGDFATVTTLWPRILAQVDAKNPLVSPFYLLLRPTSRAIQRLCAETRSGQFAIDRARPVLRPRGARRIRLGYLSSTLYAHATGILAAGLFEAHDRTQFELFAYSMGPNDASPLRLRLEMGFDHFVETADWAAQAIAQRIEADEIDILIDLDGHILTRALEVGALRPAPVQVAYLGYPGTSGASWIDYVIGDATVTPREHQVDYSEAIVALPHSYQINDSRRSEPSQKSRSELGLPEDGCVFCCFHAGNKINEDVVDAWSEVARAVDRSVLWFLLRPGEELLRDNLIGAFRSRGIEQARLRFAGSQKYPDYLGMLACADLFLDAWPYGGHTTTSDALWVGCPAVTWLGDSFPARVAASLLNAVGLPDLIARDRSGFIALAIGLARDPDRLAQLRSFLLSEGRRGPLFDTKASTLALESAYRTMLEQCAHGGPAPFAVTAPSPRESGPQPRRGLGSRLLARLRRS
ncbi:MAG: hypothetical protein ABSF50_05930 [Burkholderiaceae bacterium]|jgi:predicted O-linked N-acetylglucosamine transferase (SPINDLY family)